MHLIRHAVIAATIIATTLVLPARAETVKLTFLLTNDIYKVDNTSGRGGFARLNAVVKAERAKGGHVIYAHAGDLISPSLLSGFDQGAHTIALTNMAPPDIFTPGNHEFDFGEEVFLKRMGEARFPLFAANLRRAGGSPLPGFKDMEIRDVDGLKLGLLGLTAEDSPVKSTPGDGLVFASTFDTATAKAAELRAQGADMVVAVAHANRALDMRMFNSGSFDIILSGDDHDLALMFDGKTVLAESKEEAEFVTAIDVTAEVTEKDGKRTVSWFPNFRIIDTAAVTPDPETQAKADAYNAELDQDLNVTIGTTSEPLDSRKATLRSQEAAMGNLVADALRASVKADIAITNGGGIRGNKEYAENAAGRFPQVSGLVLEADLMKPKGQRVIAVTIAGKPLERTATYTLATNDYMFAGGDGYTALSAGKPLLSVRDGQLMANDVMGYIARNKTIAPKVEGRIWLRM